MSERKDLHGLPGNEQKVYRKLNESLHPPAELKKSVLKELKNSNLIQPSRIQTIMYRVAAIATALLIGFLAGSYNFNNSPTPMVKTDQLEYLMILYNDGFSSEKEEAELAREYIAWKEELTTNGIILSSNRLSDESRYIGQHVREAGKSAVSGYYLITASDLDQAVQLAQTHPHITYNGGIEVRPVFQ